MTSNRPHPRFRSYEALDLGPLPAERINAALGTDLSPGAVRLSSQAHRHVAEDHPDDYATCIAALPAAIASPTFAGQAPGHGRNFEIVRRIAGRDAGALLVAIGLELDSDGAYRVRSCYIITRETLERRRQAGRLCHIPPE